LRFITQLILIIFIFAGCAGTQDLATPEEIHIKNLRQLTFGGENAEAYFSGDNQKLILQSTRDGHTCDQIYVLEISSGNLERITFSPEFDGFPMFSYDGKHLAFASNRNHQAPHETNIFIADWVE
jgi:Tol biopolymer transport system component